MRRSWFNPEKILADAGLRQGMVFADIGCGDGFFAILAAEVVGKNGVVYAVDADASAIERLRNKVHEKGLANVEAVAGKAENMIFCQSCADIVFYSVVLHDFQDPEKVLENARQMLKPSGRLVDLDWKKKRTMKGPPIQIRFSEQQARQLIETAGFRIETIYDAGKDHYIIFAKLQHCSMRA